MDKQRTWLSVLAIPLLMGGIMILVPLAGSAAAGNLAAVPPGYQQPAAQVTRVTMSEYTIAMPAALPSGINTFQVTNRGTKAHNLRIQGGNTALQFASNLVPGETRVMQVNLGPGDYRVDCPVDAHALLGMATHITVH